jgi:hypothetical protein
MESKQPSPKNPPPRKNPNHNLLQYLLGPRRDQSPTRPEELPLIAVPNAHHSLRRSDIVTWGPIIAEAPDDREDFCEFPWIRALGISPTHSHSSRQALFANWTRDPYFSRSNVRRSGHFAVKSSIGGCPGTPRALSHGRCRGCSTRCGMSFAAVIALRGGCTRSISRTTIHPAQQ